MLHAKVGRLSVRLQSPNVSLDQVWTLGLLAGLLVAQRALPIRPQDFWWHIRAGQEILATGRIPATDTFSFTAFGVPYNYASFWLMECMLYLLHHWGGPALVLLTQRLTIAGTYLAVFLLCRQISRSSAIAGLAFVFAVIMGAPSWNVRPQVIAFPLTALFIWAIYTHGRRPQWRVLAVLPPAMVIWANSHGSFVMGLLLLGIWFAAEAWHGVRSGSFPTGGSLTRSWLGPASALAASGLACLINPRGAGIVTYVRSLATSPVIREMVPEWSAPSFSTSVGAVFLVGLLASAVVLALSPQRPTAFQILTFVGFGALGLLTERGMIWFGIAMAPVLAEHLAVLFRQAAPLAVMADRRSVQADDPENGRTERPSAGAPAARQSRPRRVLNLVVGAVLLIGSVAALPWPGMTQSTGPHELISRETPVAATTYLLEVRPPGALFNESSFGSYLIWAAQPQYPVFVDPRIELYPEDLWLQYLAISNAAAGWQLLLDRYGINTLMLDRYTQPALIAAASGSTTWRRLYEDDRAVIFTRVP